MKVETYEIEEINNSEASTMAADSEAIALIEKLGLTGQQALVNPDTATRFAYPHMTKLQETVFRACFPARCSLADFRHEIIPLRVLQVAAFCKDFPQTSCLEVWHTAIPKQDPILVGKAGPYDSDYYLLARWGDALPTFEELVIKSRGILEATYKSKLAKVRAKVSALEAELAELAEAVELAVTTGEEPSFSIYI